MNKEVNPYNKFNKKSSAPLNPHAWFNHHPYGKIDVKKERWLRPRDQQETKQKIDQLFASRIIEELLKEASKEWKEKGAGYRIEELAKFKQWMALFSEKESKGKLNEVWKKTPYERFFETLDRMAEMIERIHIGNIQLIYLTQPLREDVYTSLKVETVILLTWEGEGLHWLSERIKSTLKEKLKANVDEISFSLYDDHKKRGEGEAFIVSYVYKGKPKKPKDVKLR